MVKQTQIDRGKKWTEVRAKALFENMGKDVKWIDETPAIQKDIQAYEATLKPVETKSKEKK